MSSSDFKINLQFLSTGLDEVINGFTKLKTAMDQTNAGNTSLATSTKSVAAATEKAKPSLLQLGTSFGTVTAAGWSLYNSYDSLEKVKASSEKSNTRVKTSLLAVQDAEQKLAAAIAKYGAGSKEAAEATAELAVKKEQLANASEIAAIKAEDVREAYAQFATTLPTMILSVVNAGASFQKMVTDMGGIHKIAPQVTSALQAVGGGFKAILMNPIGLVLTAIATVFVLLATNAFGFRDAVNALGKAIGDALPFLQPFLDLIGGAANWFLNLINPVGEASAQLDTLGTSATGAGTAMEATQAQVEGLGGVMVNQSDVITDVVAKHQELVTQQTANQTAYEAWKTAIETGNTELVDSYNLTGEQITKFEEQYAKEMEDSQKAAEEAAEKAYEAWKKSIEDSRKEVEKGFGVLESGFKKIQSDIASALDEGGKEFKKILKKYGLDPDNPLVLEAIVQWAINTVSAEDKITSFIEYVAQNIDLMKNGSFNTFSSMVSQWVTYISDEEPKAAAAVSQWGTTMISTMKQKLESGEAKTPAEAFLKAIGETLSPENATTIAKLFGVKFPETTIEEFKKGQPKVETAVTTNITTPISAKLKEGSAGWGTTTATGMKTVTSAISIEATNSTTAIKKLVTDGQAEFKKMVTNTKKFASDMKAELSPVAQLFKDVLKLPEVPQSRYGSQSMANGGQKIQQATLSPEFLKQLGVSDEEANAPGSFGTFVNQPIKQNAELVEGAGQDPSALAKAWQDAATAIRTAVQQISTVVLGMQSSLSASIIGISQALLGLSKNAGLVPPVFQSMGQQISNIMLGIQAAISAVAIGISQTLLELATNVRLVGPVFQTTATQISAVMLGMQTAISAVAIGIGQAFLGLATVLAQFTTTTIQLTTNVSASFLAMKTSVTASMLAVQTASSTLSTTIATHTASMTTKINAFATAMDTAMKKITTSMNTAKTAADNLKKSIDALKDKTITITTRYVTSGSPAGQHGYSGIVGAPGNVGGVKVGEGFRPELITVTPLTRGTGNHYGATMGGGFGSPGGRGGGEVVNNITVVLDGRVIQRFVEKTALAGIGAQI